MNATSPNELSPQERSKIVDFLDSHPVGVIATVNSDGNPHASTIYFSVDNDLNVSFTTKRDTNKHKNISQHDTVMLAAYDSESQSTVQLTGRATEVHEPEQAQQIYRGTLRAADHTGEDNVPPIAKIPAGPYVAYIIRPSDIWMSDYSWGNNFANALSQLQEPANTDDPA